MCVIEFKEDLGWNGELMLDDDGVSQAGPVKGDISLLRCQQAADLATAVGARKNKTLCNSFLCALQAVRAQWRW